TLAFDWVLVAPGGSTALLDNGGTAQPSFTPDIAGTYTASLIVSDGITSSAADDVTIAVTHRPVADAGPDQTVTLGDLVTLDGTGPSDGDGDALTYGWSMTGPDGSGVVLSNPLAAQPTFTPDLVGTYTATLSVTDGLFTTTTDTVTI